MGNVKVDPNFKPESHPVEIKVTIDDITETVKGEQNKTLLENLLDSNIDAPYSCMDGACTSCLATVNEVPSHKMMNIFYLKTILKRENV